MVSLKDRYVFHCFFFFLININDLPKILIDDSKILLFADYTSVITTNPGSTNFQNFQDINSWFNTNVLSLNIDKTLHVICN